MTLIATTGATGEVGGRVARLLDARGIRQRLIVRDPNKAPNLSLAEVAAYGGYSDINGMETAFEGVSTLFLVSAKEAADRQLQHAAAVDAAVAAGASRIVYLSFIGAAANATFTFARDHYHTEERIKRSGVSYTFSRQSLYMDLLPFIGGPDGVIRGPAGRGRLAPVSRDDVAEAIAELLIGSGHDGATYTLTGPESYSMGDIAKLLTESGRVTRFENETPEQAYASRTVYGAPDWEVEGWVTTYLAIANGELDLVTEDVTRLTGRKPVSVQAFLSGLPAAG